MCYNEHMDRTIRNLDEDVYRQLKARAALRGATVGELINEAIRAWLARPDGRTRSTKSRRSATRALPGWQRALERRDRLSLVDATIVNLARDQTEGLVATVQPRAVERRGNPTPVPG